MKDSDLLQKSPCFKNPFQLNQPWKSWTTTAGVIKLTILGGSNVCKCMVILMDFPNNCTLFGLVIKSPLTTGGMIIWSLPFWEDAGGTRCTRSCRWSSSIVFFTTKDLFGDLWEPWAAEILGEFGWFDFCGLVLCFGLVFISFFFKEMKWVPTI